MVFPDKPFIVSRPSATIGWLRDHPRRSDLPEIPGERQSPGLDSSPGLLTSTTPPWRRVVCLLGKTGRRGARLPGQARRIPFTADVRHRAEDKQPSVSRAAPQLTVQPHITGFTNALPD